MTKTEKVVTFGYIYDNARAGAKYSLDGVHFMNGGDFAEIVAKWAFGYDMTKDANGRFDVCSDIPELSASVKSSKATLTSAVLGNSYESVKATYFEKVHSTMWIWVAMIENTAVIYQMNKAEFAEFMDNFGGYDESRKVIRFKSTSTKMLKYLEERL